MKQCWKCRSQKTTTTRLIHTNASDRDSFPLQACRIIYINGAYMSVKIHYKPKGHSSRTYDTSLLKRFGYQPVVRSVLSPTRLKRSLGICLKSHFQLQSSVTEKLTFRDREKNWQPALASQIPGQPFKTRVRNSRPAYSAMFEHWTLWRHQKTVLM